MLRKVFAGLHCVRERANINKDIAYIHVVDLVTQHGKLKKMYPRLHRWCYPSGYDIAWLLLTKQHGRLFFKF